MQRPESIQEFKTELHITKSREMDIINLIAECTVVENDLKKFMNECTESGILVDRKMLIMRWNELKKEDPYYKNIEKRQKTVDNCIINVINNIIYEYDRKSNKHMDKVSFKRQVTISNALKKDRCISIDINKPNVIYVEGIGDITMRKKLRTTVVGIHKLVLTRSGNMKVYLYQ